MIEILRPIAAGDETSIPSQWPGGEHWDKVDEAVADDGSTYVTDDTHTPIWYRDLYNLPASSELGTINFIKIYLRCRGSTSGMGAKPSLKSNSIVTDGREIEPTIVWTTYSQRWNTNPADNQAWERSDIDNLQIGISLRNSDRGYTWCTQVYVEIDYTPEVAPPVPLEGWLPMPPNMGPPLPKFLQIFWPWYK